jgi:hypothetical protein
MARDRDRDDDRDEPRRPRRNEDDERYSDAPRSRRRDEDDERYSDAPRARRRDDDDYDEDDDRPRRRRSGGGSRMNPEDLRTVAMSQKAIIYCILGEVCTIPLRFAMNAMMPEAQLVAALLLLAFYLVVGITAAVFIFMMAVKVYSTGVGVLLGILTLIPCIGLIVLLIINAKATSIMRQNGVRVGLLGANMSDLP